MRNKTYFPLFLILLLFGLIACTASESPAATEVPATETAQQIDTPPQIEIITATETPTETPVTLPTETSPTAEWTTHTIDLYTLQLETPSDWSIAELNRQAEPTDGGLVLGHDCAEYSITNPDGTIQLHLSPACRLGEGASFLCPPNTTIIGTSPNGSELVRFYESNSMTYGYTEADSELTYCADSPRLSFTDGGVQTYLEIVFDYTGSEENLPQTLEITDRIISSITWPTETSTSTEWTTHTIDLYALQLETPSDWSIAELNRQAEPTDGGLVLGHDCAEYSITNPDGTIQLHLSPACGFGEGASFLCPADTTIIGASTNGSELVRFYEPNSMRYSYTEADSELTYCVDSPRLSFTDGGVQTYMEIVFDYAGNEENLPQTLEITDRIISSVSSQP